MGSRHGEGEAAGGNDLVAGTQVKQWRVSEEEEGVRLDVFMARHTSEAFSRTYIQSLLEAGNAAVDGETVTRASHTLKDGQEIKLVIPPARPQALEPEPIPLDVVYEDDDLLVINKQRNLVVHPAPGHHSGTLVHALLHHCSNLSSINNIMRPGIVHRLDKDTTGLMVVAKNNTAHLDLSYQLKKRWMKREYYALVYGVPEVKRGKIDMRVGRDPDNRFKMAVVKSGGKRAVTWFTVSEVIDEQHSLLHCQLETGRTHQIRVHMSYIGHPVVADPLYAPDYPGYGLEGQALHATKIAFEHPTSREKMEFSASLPEDVQEVIESLRSGRIDVYET